MEIVEFIQSAPYVHVNTQIVLCSVFTYVGGMIYCKICSYNKNKVLLVITLLQTGSRDEGSDKDLAYTPDSLPMRSGEDDPALKEHEISNSQ